VAVSAGMAPLALGTETDGSIVAPAGLCGVVGVKPEFGRLPAHGIVPISTELDTVGLLAARVCDATLALEELDGIPPIEPVRGGLRLGLWLVPGMAASLGSFLSGPVEKLRRAGVAVVPVKLRDLVGKIFFTHYEPGFRDNERRVRAGQPMRGGPLTS
jgi:amidase